MCDLCGRMMKCKSNDDDDTADDDAPFALAACETPLFREENPSRRSSSAKRKVQLRWKLLAAVVPVEGPGSKTKTRVGWAEKNRREAPSCDTNRRAFVSFSIEDDDRVHGTRERRGADARRGRLRFAQGETAHYASNFGLGGPPTGSCEKVRREDRGEAGEGEGEGVWSGGASFRQATKPLVSPTYFIRGAVLPSPASPCQALPYRPLHATV